MPTEKWRIGEVTVPKVVEMEMDFPLDVRDGSAVLGVYSLLMRTIAESVGRVPRAERGDHGRPHARPLSDRLVVEPL